MWTIQLHYLDLTLGDLAEPIQYHLDFDVIYLVQRPGLGHTLPSNTTDRNSYSSIRGS